MKVTMSKREARLREVAVNRLARLKEREEKIRKHLESVRGRNDHQTLHFLLHQIEVERNDLFNNLKDSSYAPKLGKAKREKRKGVLAAPTLHIKVKGPPPTPSKYSIRKPVAGNNLPKFASKYDAADERSEDDDKGRSWTSAPYVEALFPVQGRDRVINALRKFVQKDERAIVRDWAEGTFGSIEDAKPALLAGATIEASEEVWRSWLAQAKSPSEFDRASERVIAEAMANDSELKDKAGKRSPEGQRIRRTVLLVAGKHWVDGIVKSIKESAPVGTDKDTLDRRLRSAMKSFHTAANSGKHTNPQFPYLTEDKPTVLMEDVVTAVMEFLDTADDKDRYIKHKEDDKKRHKVSILQKELGKARPRKRLEIARQKWAGKSYVQGTISKKRDASLVWDGSAHSDGLMLAMPMDRFAELDSRRFFNQDGSQLDVDYQLVRTSGTQRAGDFRIHRHEDGFPVGRGCALLPLRPKHDFLRWYTKHVENHNADAPLERRCIHNTTQFVIVDPDGPNPRLFVRPVFKFYDPGKTVANSQGWDKESKSWKKPDCRYLIGIDRGINYVLRAVVVDTETKHVIADIALPGRKHEWKAIRDEIAYHQQMRDNARNNGAHPSVIARHAAAIARARKKDRGLGKTETVEAVAKLVAQCERDYGTGNYCFILEDLDMGAMNLKRNNRVKHLAAMKDALVYQLRKHGYAYNKISKQVDGVRYESARFTSQISPFRWWGKRDEIEAAWKADSTRPIGRRVGNWYEDPEEMDGVKPDLCRLGKWAKPKNLEGKHFGRNRFVVEPGDEDPDKPRRRSWGSELFWDPNQSLFKGHAFPHGVVLDADFVGALNIALRPLVCDGQGKGFNTEMMAEGHTKLNPTFGIVCPIPVYEFVEYNGNPRGALRKLVL